MAGEDGGSGGMVLQVGSGAIGALVTLGAAMLRAWTLKKRDPDAALERVVGSAECQKVQEHNQRAHQEMFARMNALEVGHAVTRTHLENIEKTAGRMEDKLDRFLDGEERPRSHRTKNPALTPET